ncbi:malate synthase A [Kutzneria viridogrisea]|uniref:Malate synthase n=1 Tax=Kutzneria viridogrisea TaxID=47990 RepID=A0ABR6BZ50_9PSEU|nr:malate synthase [Kutzneria viridogrisea]
MHAHSRTEITGTIGHRYQEVLTPEALAFVTALDDQFAQSRTELLAQRRERRERFATGELPGFLPETSAVRADPHWHVAPPAPGLTDRRVEITGPPHPKMAVNALNSGAKVWMADLEDATSPSWHNIITGQLTLLDAAADRLDLTTEGGKRYWVADNPATIVVRPRGWHLVDKHILIDGRPISASLLDFGLHLWHNARRLLDRGTGPYYYLPKLEGHREARLWNEVFCHAQDQLGLPRGTIRATVLIETITAAFEMEEILHELREHSSGLNAGRWDYIFSVIKNFGHRPEFVLPDRADVAMTVPFMRAYTEHLVATCHRRGAHAIGGMAAFIPSRDPETNTQALAKVAQDKQREAADGFDGSWVAHPGLVATCEHAFDPVLGLRPHQLDRQRTEVTTTAEDLLAVNRTPGRVTEPGLRNNISVALHYFHAWLNGSGAVAINGLMEDAATAEIARCQVWQWLHHTTPLAEGGTVTEPLVRALVDKELLDLPPEHRDAARALFEHTTLTETPPAFFTTTAYATHLAGTR